MEENTTIAENTQPSVTNYSLNFHGKGGEYFSIVIVNWLLTVITLGLYYPWAKARQLQYLYGATELEGDRFTFHGTGKEMFKGFIKAILIFAIIYGGFFALAAAEMPILAVVYLYAGLIALIPLAIHGSYRYRMSRTSWRGIRFGYRGQKTELILNMAKWLFLTLITFGIYGAWMEMNMRKYVLENVRMGNARFLYKGEGLDYFLLNIIGYFLSIITLGIYIPWWLNKLFAYYVDNLVLYKDDKPMRMKSTATGGGFWGLFIINLVILIFTLGLGYAFVVTRTMNYLVQHIELEGEIDLSELQQTEDAYTDATGEDLSDMLDIDFVF